MSNVLAADNPSVSKVLDPLSYQKVGKISHEEMTTFFPEKPLEPILLSSLLNFFKKNPKWNFILQNQSFDKLDWFWLLCCQVLLEPFFLRNLMTGCLIGYNQVTHDMPSFSRETLGINENKWHGKMLFLCEVPPLQNLKYCICHTSCRFWFSSHERESGQLGRQQQKLQKPHLF